MRRFFLVIATYFCIMSATFANHPLTHQKKIQVTPGLYILDISRPDFKNNTFDVIFWLFMTTPKSNATYNPLEQTEISNAISQHLMLKDSYLHKDGSKTYTAKIKATIRQPLSFKNYPYDQQVLKIKIENSHFDLKKLTFSATNKQMAPTPVIDPDFSTRNWRVLRANGAFKVKHYATDFKTNHPGTFKNYAQYQAKLILERINHKPMFMSFLLLYIAVFLSAIAILIPNTHPISPKISCSIGAVFALCHHIAGHANTATISTELSLSSKLELATFIIILITLLGSHFSYLKLKSNMVWVYKLIGFGIIPIFTLYNYYLITHLY